MVEPTALTHPGALATARAATGPFSTLVECRVTEKIEFVVFDVDVERPQTPVNDIRARERIAGVFLRDDDKLPEVLALRDDFPIVPHLNLRDEEVPRSLCLYDQAWSELKMSWTGTGFVERIRWWLAFTARGELHGEDQPLEPLMFSHGFDLVVTAEFGLDKKLVSLPARVGLVGGSEGRVLVCWNAKAQEFGGMRSFVMYIDTPPRPHGVIRHTPKSIADLAALVDDDGFSLLEHLRTALWSIPEEIRKNPKLRRLVAPVFVLGLPKTRSDGGSVEAMEMKGFISFDGIESVGVAVGAWVVDGPVLAQVLGGVNGADGADAAIVVTNVVRELTLERAAAHSGLPERDDRRIVAIGLGALGSQVAMNLARSGTGQWTLIDNDVFMPHNAVRHALEGGNAVGHNKAECMAVYMNSISPSEQIAHHLAVDYLAPSDDQVRVVEAVSSADLVLDMSASVAVARTLADEDRSSRTASLFLAPSGAELVLLIEDVARQTRLDDLEMLYYKALATKPELKGHLDDVGAKTRYGASCRDVSRSMSQNSIGTLAGIGATAIGQSRKTADASIRIWSSQPETLGVSSVDIELDGFTEIRQYGWRVRVSHQLFADISALREDRLPNETGGILLGGVDHARRCVHVVLALASPPDSEEWPTMYIRGVKGLQAERERVVRATAGNLDYLGEWHSHPRGATTKPSEDDGKVFEWICEIAAVDGRPAIMLIAGDSEVRLFIAEFEPSTEPICLPS